MDFSLNWLTIGAVTIGHFILGAVWFSAIFGKQWMWIHHGKKVPTEKEMAEMGAGMWKLMLAEFLATFLLTIGLACLVNALSGSPYNFSGVHVGFMIWVAFILPMIVSNTIWGNDRREAWIQKIIISSVYRLIALVASGYVLAMW